MAPQEIKNKQSLRITTFKVHFQFWADEPPEMHLFRQKLCGHIHFFIHGYEINQIFQYFSLSQNMSVL